MSKVRSDQYTDRAGTASPLFPLGVRVTGVATATSFSGNLTGAVTSSGALSITDATASTNTTSGALIVSGGVGIAKSLNVGGNLSVGGTLTYEDVTNIDSVGIVTAGGGLYVGRAGGTGIGLTASTAGHVIAAGIITTGTCLKVGSISGGTFGTGVGVTITGDGNAVFSGISTFAGGANFNGGSLLKEKVNITAGKLSANLNIDLENGMVHHFTTTETTTAVPNIRVSSSVALNTMMEIGETITVSVITTAAAAGYSAQWTIDGSAVTEAWNGGSAPSAGGSSGKDFYTLNIIKTANATFTVLANVSNFA